MAWLGIFESISYTRPSRRPSEQRFNRRQIPTNCPRVLVLVLIKPTSLLTCCRKERGTVWDSTHLILSAVCLIRV